jgi:hypothetical protein
VAEFIIRKAAVQELIHERMIDGGVPICGAVVSEFFGKAHGVSSWKFRNGA